MKGSREVRVGPILISCISGEARDLLDRLCEEYEKFCGRKPEDDNGYGVLYWAVRYSGLIVPAKG